MRWGVWFRLLGCCDERARVRIAWENGRGSRWWSARGLRRRSGLPCGGDVAVGGQIGLAGEKWPDYKGEVGVKGQLRGKKDGV